MPEILAKGPNFVFARDFIFQEYGQGSWDAMLAKLPDDVANIWRAITLDDAYPFSGFKAGVFALSEVLGSPEMVETARMYQYIADRSLNSVYKTFFRLTSPMFVIKNYPRLWDRFFTAGKVEITSTDEKNRAIVKFTLPEIFLDWLSPACLGYSQKAVEMAGGKYFTMRQLDRKQVSEELWEISYKLGWK